MTIKTWTATILIVVAITLSLWDVFASVQRVPGDTISEVIWGVASRHPILPFALGVLMGHLFWQR